MDPPLCANGCGFFGSHENQNMCSKCYEDHILKLSLEICESTSYDQDMHTADVHKNDESYQDHIIKLSLQICELSSSSFHDQYFYTAYEHKDVNFLFSASKLDESKKKKRCKSCNKKVGVTGFKCQCGDLFCGKHRYPEEHSCTVDYKQIGRQLIQKQNPLCKTYKLLIRV